MRFETNLAGAFTTVAILLAFALSVTQAFIGAKVGSDHPVHVFLTRGIRNNGFRLFVRIPKLLNTCFCAAVPLYLHWLIAHFRDRAVYWAERLLNPSVNTLHVGVFAVIAGVAASANGWPPLFAPLAACAFALTPQFFHALSARNFGLSSRGTGLLLLTLFFLSAHAVEDGSLPVVTWASLVLAAWLVWGFSTFGQQAMCILSVLLLLMGGRWIPLAGAALGLLVFVALHPAYSLSYLRHTLRFIATYASELAPIYILNRRHSIWRDLVRDIWLKLGQDVKKGAHYAYENSVIIVTLLNPLVLVACAAALLRPPPDSTLIAFGQTMSVAGTLAVLLTSLRATRFLGEPERYAEVITPWATLAGGYEVYNRLGPAGLIALVLAFLTLDLLQLMASRLLLRQVADNDLALRDVEIAIETSVPADVRFCCNNEQITKKLMQNDWSFAYYLAAGQDYCGLSATEIFSTFPYLRRQACEQVVAAYRVNACLLDRRLYDTLFDQAPATLRCQRVAWENDRFRLLVLDWAGAA
jgi:hypothetical protein